jgi:hypothetical protein
MVTTNMILEKRFGDFLQTSNRNKKIIDYEVFGEISRSYINELKLFMAHYNAIPNFINECNIDCKSANLQFSEDYEPEIKNIYYSKIQTRNQRKSEIDDVFYFLYEDLIVQFDTFQSTVRFLFSKTDISLVNNIIDRIRRFKFRRKINKPELYLLIKSQSEIIIQSFQIAKPKLSIPDNYNDDFYDIHKQIINRLSKKNDKGLVLLHGMPGTGKTSYIRYLITSLKKNVIFLPTNMADAVTNPSLITILIANPNSIFVIEDAENIILDRKINGNSSVSTLLNITDGLLADCLNIQIICSFNVDISKVDSALLRKGRIIAKYEFKELEIEKAQKLSDKLGFTTQITRKMSLTSIYNQNETDYISNDLKKAIGFK